MTIIHQKNTETYKFFASEYNDENELQEIIADNPELIATKSDPEIALVKREVRLPDAGNVDIVFIDSEGIPILVEVKLAHNAESRRKILAQGLDYVSAIADFSVYEFDAAVNGLLTDAINKLVGEKGNSHKADAIKKKCSAHLKANRAMLVLAVDKAHKDLIRMVKHANLFSSEVRLVEIQKYSINKNERILVSNFIVPSVTDVAKPIRTTPEEISTKRLHKQILTQLKQKFEDKYEDWSKKLGDYIGFGIYQAKDGSWTSLHIDWKYQEKGILVLSLDISPALNEKGQEGFCTTLWNRYKTSTFVKDVKANKEILYFLEKNNFKFEEGHKYSKYIPMVEITYEDVEKIADQEIEAMKPIIEKLLA